MRPFCFITVLFCTLCLNAKDKRDVFKDAVHQLLFLDIVTKTPVSDVLMTGETLLLYQMKTEV